MYIVWYNGQSGRVEFCVHGQNNLFLMTTLLENSNVVTEFKVAAQGTVLLPDIFGFGTYTKWVNKFSYETL